MPKKNNWGGARPGAGRKKKSLAERIQDESYRQTIAPFGCDWNDGVLSIIPEEALVVKRIYAMTLNGCGMMIIARTLNEEQILLDFQAVLTTGAGLLLWKKRIKF